MNKDYIQKKIKKLLKLESQDLHDLAFSKNIIILEYELGDEMSGLYLYIEKRKLILLNSRLSDCHKKIVLAHEMGHAVLHTKVNCAFTRKYTYSKPNIYENEANYFASELLAQLGFLNDDTFCILSKELTSLDDGFIEMFNNFI